MWEDLVSWCCQITMNVLMIQSKKLLYLLLSQLCEFYRKGNAMDYVLEMGLWHPQLHGLRVCIRRRQLRV